MSFDFGGEDTLLGIEEILKKLGISRSTLERIRRDSPLLPGQAKVITRANLNDDFDGLLPFPPPTIILGRNPRWSVSVLNEWIKSAQQAVPGRLVVSN